ncbi:MAG: hypothetical protein CMO81_04245 [Waddliaceae bacterium]|nr:hypothetical protein [Waddliaceae bacterium]
MLHTIYYGHPELAFLFLGLLPLVALFVWESIQRQKAILLFPVMGEFRSKILHRTKRALALLAWIFLCCALIQPRGNPRYPEDKKTEALQLQDSDPEIRSMITRRLAHDIVFLLDVSASMEVTDMRTGQSRLDYAKEVIDELVEQLRGENAGIFAFTSELSAVSPPTVDYLFLRLMLRQVGINEGDIAGTDLLEALDATREKFFSQTSNKYKTLVVLTDGGDTQLELSKGEERERILQAILGRIADAEKYKLQVFTIGLGTASGDIIPGVEFEGKAVQSSLDEELLKRLSDTGNGRYFFANQYSAMGIADALAREIQNRQLLLEESEEEIELDMSALSNREPIFDEYFQYPLSLAIISILLSLLIPSTKRRMEMST